MENFKKELEAIEFAIDNLDATIIQLKKYKEDCQEIAKDLNGNLKELEYIANEIEKEIEDENQKLIKENDDEICAMNYEFEKERI